MMDWTAEAMIRYGTLRIEQGTADRSPLLAGVVDKPRLEFDLRNWQPPKDARLQ